MHPNVNTDYLVLAELWTVLIFYTIFIFYIFYHSYYIYKKEKKSLEEGKKKRHILWISHPQHSAAPPKLTSIY